MAGWDQLRRERHTRQLRMGLLDKRWPLTERPPDSPAWESLTSAQKEHFDLIMAIYAATIRHLDLAIGALVDGLRQRGELDNTLLLFMSDNGGNGESGPSGRLNGNPPGSADSDVYLGMNWATLANTPFRRYKHFTHEGGVSTPLIAHWPAGIPQQRAGKFEHQPGHLIDVMPTVLEAAGVKWPQSIRDQTATPPEGISLLPACSGGKLARKQPVFFMHEGNRGVRSGQWKLVSKYLDEWELYDMGADRTETNNLAAAKPELVRDLAASYDAWAKRTNTDPWTGPRRTDWGQELKE